MSKESEKDTRSRSNVETTTESKTNVPLDQIYGNKLEQVQVISYGRHHLCMLYTFREPKSWQIAICSTRDTSLVWQSDVVLDTSLKAEIIRQALNIEKDNEFTTSMTMDQDSRVVRFDIKYTHKSLTEDQPNVSTWAIESAPLPAQDALKKQCELQHLTWTEQREKIHHLEQAFVILASKHAHLVKTLSGE